MVLAEATLDERALVRSLKLLRTLIEEEHALETERAERIAPVPFDSALPSAGEAGRAYVFRTRGTADGVPLRVGDGVEVGRPDGREASLAGVVAALGPAGVVVDFGRPVTTSGVPATGVLRPRVDGNQRAIRLQAIERVVRERERLGWIGAVLTDATPYPLAEATCEPASGAGLTDNQRSALAGASRSRDVFLIQGPPGTGKTTVIAELVRALVGRGARVLLSAKGHRAIDNTLDRLGSGDLHVLRLGQVGKVTGAGQEVRLADVLAQAEQEAPRRHRAARTQLEAWLRSLEALERVLVELAAVNRALHEAETRLAEQAADGTPPADGAATDAARARVGELRARLEQVTARADSMLPGVADGACGLKVPHVSIATAEETRATLRAVRGAQNQARLVLDELGGWGTLIEQPGAVRDVLVETTDVIAATAVGVSSGRDGARIASLEFDVAIVDEAGQAQLTDLVVPLSRAPIVVLVGDHQQLPPYVDDDLVRRCVAKGIATDVLETSVFEQLWERLPRTHRVRLNTQFRMPEAIAGFLGRAFYADDLATAAAKQGSAPVCDLFAAPVVLVDTAGASERGETAVSPGFLNRCEARLVADIVARLPAQYRAGQGLGVISPYSAQVAAMRQAIAGALGLAAGDAWLIENVATVDSFQGQERDVVVVSLTRSNADGMVGFLSDLKRLNVTLSRARRQLVVIGDLATHCAPGGGAERQAFARFARDLAGHVGEHGELIDVAALRERLARG